MVSFKPYILTVEVIILERSYLSMRSMKLIESKLRVSMKLIVSVNETVR